MVAFPQKGECEMSEKPFLGSSGFLPKSKVNYANSTSEKKCANCDYFILDEPLANGCEVVEGPVEEGSVCKMWFEKH